MNPNINLPTVKSEYHPIVRGWFREHKTLQLDRAISDLTARDIYRFQVTSIFLKKLKTTKIRIQESSIEGVFNVVIGQEKLAIRITEKMRRGLDELEWTAFQTHHHPGLVSRGLLRFAISTRPVREFVETNDGDFEDERAK